LLISANWFIYIYAVLADHVIDAALGYFINPLVTVALAVVFLKEKLNPAQAIALGIAVLAVVVIVVGYGRVPWIGIGLALSFGVYSLVKKRVGHRVTPFIGLGIETLALGPIAGIYILVMEVTRQGTLTTISLPYALLLIATGVVTAVPLLLFAIGAARLPLVMLAFIQYLTPVIQFLFGVFLFHEAMPLVRWIGFILVWVALVVLSADLVRRARGREE
jgi:chloramphenicol-sensitive protein RarD